MKIVVSGRQMQISHHLNEYIEQKVKKLGKHMPSLGEIRVEAATNETRAESDRFSCQLTTWIDHHMLNAESSADTIYKAVNQVVAKLDRQLDKVKVQHQHKGRPSLAANTEQITAQSPQGAK